MSAPQDPRRQDDSDGRAPISPLGVPALFGGLVLGFLSGYFFLGWGAIAVVVVLLGAVTVAVRGSEHRDAAVMGLLGTAIGFVGVMLVAGFRGVVG